MVSGETGEHELLRVKKEESFSVDIHYYEELELKTARAVSYTHLDVYKSQILMLASTEWQLG